MISKEAAADLCKSWGADYEALFSKISQVFARSESREKAKAYLRGLMSDVKRKNSWQLSAYSGMEGPIGLQRLLNEDKWNEAELMRQSRKLLVEAAQPGDVGMIGVVDESGFIKKGKRSAGVQKQYCGRIGKVENCQVGVFLGLVSEAIEGFLDRRLYLPQSWCEDEIRCEQARIPREARAFKTKPELALEMLEAARAEGIKLSWVTGDTLYGNSPGFREGLADQGQTYVLALSMNHKLDYQGQTLRIDQLLKQLKSEAFSLTTERLSEQGLIKEDWALLKVNFAEKEQLLIFRKSRRGIEAYLSNAPETTPEEQLINVILARHSIERLFKEAKSELGLADYEVRFFHAWLRHISLVFLAHTFLSLCLKQQKKPGFPASVV